MLAAVSGGAVSEAVVEAALRLETATGARATFLHVAPEIALPFARTAGSAEGRHRGPAAEPTADPAATARRLLQARGRELVEREGLVVDEVLAEVEHGAHDLLVVGAPPERDRSWGREDTTERLLLACPTSTLIVRIPDHPSADTRPRELIRPGVTMPCLPGGVPMSSAVAAPTLTGEEIVALCRRHTIFEWSAQAKVDPIPVDRAEGVYFWTPEGKRYLDFNSQLMCTNIGHSHPRVIKAIQEQAAKLWPTPTRSWPPSRGRAWGRSSPRSPPATSTPSSSPTAEPRPTRTPSASPASVTGRHKILVRYRSYHGGTAGAIALTGDPRRWASRAGHPRHRAHPRLPQVGAQGPGAGGGQPPRHRGGDPLRGWPRTSPPSWWRRWWAPTAS